MTGNTPAASVIIPTHNRKAGLERTLSALAAQTFPPRSVEVVVVADGCDDGTEEMLEGYAAPYALRVVSQPNLGPGSARNLGAASAQAPLLIFLDDDVEPCPTFLEGHLRAHREREGQVVMGPYVPVFPRPDFYRTRLRAWWERVFEEMLRPGHRFSFSDLLTGNLSIGSETFAGLGGFHPGMRAHEDYEFGMRLIKAGVPFAASPDAAARHHDGSDIDRAFRRKREEGKSDVIMARLHPEFAGALPLGKFEWPHPAGVVRIIAFRSPGVGDACAGVSRRILDFLERKRLRSHWSRLFGTLLSYWYWRGVASELGSVSRWKALRGKDDPGGLDGEPMAEVDLAEGMEAAERTLDKERPSAVRVRLGGRLVGVIPPQPGAEELRGRHLSRLMADRLAVPLLQALALEGGITDSPTIDRRRLSAAILARSRWFGPIRPGEMWWEQYSQWEDHLGRRGRLEQEVARLEERKRHWRRIMETDRVAGAEE